MKWNDQIEWQTWALERKTYVTGGYSSWGLLFVKRQLGAFEKMSASTFISGQVIVYPIGAVSYPVTQVTFVCIWDSHLL